MGARAPRAASRRTTDVPGARRTSRTRRYAELKGVIDVLVSLPVLTGRKLAPRLLQPGCCGVVGSGPSATRDSRHTVARVTKSIIAPMPAGWHRLVRFNPCCCLVALWPVCGQSANNSVHHGHLWPQSSHAARRVLPVSRWSGFSGNEAYGSRGCAASQSRARRCASAIWVGLIRPASPSRALTAFSRASPVAREAAMLNHMCAST